MARIPRSGLFLVVIFGAWAHAQRQDLNDLSFPQRNTNNVRLVNKDFNAYREAESIFAPLSVSLNPEVPGEGEQGHSGNEDRITAAEYSQEQYRPVSPARPYWEERTYEFQYGEPKIYREQPYNRIDNYPPTVKDDVVLSPDLDVFGTGWNRFQEMENKVQQQQFQNAPPVQRQEIDFIDVLAAEPCTVTEVLTTTYFIKPRPIVTEFTYSTVLVECPPTPTPAPRPPPQPQPQPQPQPYYIEPYPYYVPCETCEYPHNCDHCPRPHVTRAPVYTVPVHKLPCDKCYHPDNCDHCPRPHLQPYPAPCELCQHPQNCDHCFRPHSQAYPAPCELCAHPQNCDHCPHPPHRVDPIPCDICRQPEVCEHCHGRVHDEKVYGVGREWEERKFPSPAVDRQQRPATKVVAVVQPKRHPQVGPQFIQGEYEKEVDASEQEEQELQW
ncbi:hypothetical protein L211DRAFT_833935 [Terfezia boudieri ATCC MYA-4762]|uniref:Uncharacterized protein n=1 Tax=Terfezia boudieri ATCC MYA-4762 TaxID=1051890 RepID=A0A3N4LYE4_9PEZI|nr:hypothetical protein L211DRAFT_833935 [Terfezia boudieri ATCC MYA-4762]